MGNYKENIINKVQVENTEYPISYTETEYQDETNNFRRYKGDLALRKVYTGVLGVENGSSPNNNTYANTSFYFLNVKPDSWYVEWTVKYHLNIHLDDENQVYKNSSGTTYYPGQTMRGLYDCMISGTQGAYSTFHFFQSQKNTSYRPIYYHMTHSPTSAGHTAGLPFKIGISLASSYLPTPTANYQSGSAVTTKYSRTIEVVVDEAINCEVSLNDILEIEADAYETGDMLNYTKLSSTYYTTSTSASNSAGRWNNLSATTQGLYESGDDNTYTYTQQSSNYLVNGTTYSDNSAGYLLGYSMIGFDKDGKALMISKKTPTTTAYNTGIDKTRVYCNAGFDYTKGIRYVSTSTNFAANAAMNVSTQINYSGLDFRYNDNCVAGSSTNNLGLVNREPVYLRGTIGSDGLFYLAPIEVIRVEKVNNVDTNVTYKRAWVQPGDATRLDTNPFDTEHVYWFVGYPYYNSSYPNSLYQLDLITQGELNTWDGTQLVPYYSPITYTIQVNDIQGTSSSGTIISDNLKNAINRHLNLLDNISNELYTFNWHFESAMHWSQDTTIIYNSTALHLDEPAIVDLRLAINTNSWTFSITDSILPDIPEFFSQPAGKVLTTNGASGISWESPESELPAYDSSKENYVLSVNSSGNLVWRAPYNGEASGS